MPDVTSSRVGSAHAQLRVLTTGGADWKGPVLPQGSAGPPGLHLDPHVCLVFTGLKLPPLGPFGT